MPPRARTEPLTRLSKRYLRVLRSENRTEPEYERPKTRGDCELGPRPCPFVGCRHHLYLDVLPTGSVKLNFPDREPHELEESCVLDVAAEGALTLDEAGTLLNVTRERIRQITLDACARMHGRGKLPPKDDLL